MRGSYDEEGNLDDGDLPSLTPKGSNSIASHILHSTQNEVTMTKRVTYNNGLKNKTDEGGRQFWDQLDDESADDGTDGSPTQSNGNHTAGNGATRSNTNYDDDGPDDEMAARRTVVISPPDDDDDDDGPLKRSYTDNSAPTDNESHLTDEEMEEEPYETSFCGQTLNAIDDMCGGTLNLSGNNINNNFNESKRNNNTRRSATTSPPIERKRRSPDYPMSADNSRSPRREYLPINEVQQENTAIEVEYVEPIKKTMSVGSDSGVSSEIKKKTLRLNAIAKKAKEKFRNKKGKSSTQSVGSEQSNDHQSMLSQHQIGSFVDDDITEAASKRSGNGGGGGATIPDAAESVSANNIPTLDITEQVDTDYNSFNAAEKRKFIKLINSGVVATIATRRVLEERSKIIEPIKEVDDDEEDVKVADNRNEIGNLDYEMTLLGVDESGTQNPSNTELNVDVSTSSASTLPFKKSGNVYYDAVRRNVDDTNDSVDVQGAEDVNNMGRPPSGLKGREFGVAQRIFGVGKPKGFAALPDSPQQRSTTTEDRMVSDEYPTEKVGSELSKGNDLQSQKEKDVSLSTSFDSFVRNRAVAEPGDISIENYQMTPTRELAKLHPYQSPGSGISTIANSEVESAMSHATLNNTADTLNEVDTVSPTSKINVIRSMSNANEDDLEHRVVPLTDVQHDGKESHLTTDDKSRGVSQSSEHQNNDDSFLSNREIEERGVDGSANYETPQTVQDEHDQMEVQSQGHSSFYTSGKKKTERHNQDLSFISTADKRGISHMDTSVDTNVNTSLDLSHQNDTMSVYTTGTSLTAYTQSSRARRPGVAKTRLAKQKELERSIENKPQGWHETILAAAESAKRTWDPEKGWVDYEAPEVVATGVDHKKEKIRIDLNRSVTSHKENNSIDAIDVQKGAVAHVPFPHEWEKEREAMIQAPNEAVSHIQRSPTYSFDNKINDLAEDDQIVELLGASQRKRSQQDKSDNKPNGRVENDHYLEVEERNEVTVALEDMHGNIDSIHIDTEAKSIDSDVYYDDVIVVEGIEEASRNAIEVVKQKVNEDDLELFPKIQRIDDEKKMNSVADYQELQEITPPSDMDRVNKSLISLDASNVSARRGAGPVDTDEVDETWDSENEDGQPNTWNGDHNQRNVVDLKEHHHIDDWKDSSKPAVRHDATSQSTSGNDTSRSAGNLTNISATSSSKKIPKLERSKRDTSPLSFRNPIEVAFPRSLESIQRHENFEVEYVQPTATTEANTSDRETAVSVAKESISIEEEIISTDTNDDTNIVRARMKEWESRIEISHSSDNGDNIEKNKSQGLLPVAAAGWRSFLSKKVQAEKTVAEAQISRTPQTEQLSEDVPPSTDIRKSKQSTREASADSMFHFTEKSEASALNLSDLSPIQVKDDDLSDYDIASSVAYGPTDEQRKSSSFLERLTECAAPIMPTKAGAFCGRPEEVTDPEYVADMSHVSGSTSEKHRRSVSYGDEKPRSLSSLRGTAGNDTLKVATSSVVSEDFGAKTAFLDSLAMKAAVSKPKRSSSSRRYEQSASSSVVSGATDHSEKWKTFLERKKASDTGRPVSEGSGADVSRAAEKYAAEKVEEIMSKMAARSKTTPRHRESRNEISDVGQMETKIQPVRQLNNANAATNALQSQANSTSAAEDLAAARVEAMMAALANANIDEGEI